MGNFTCIRVCNYYFDSFKPLHSCQEAKNASAEKWLRAAIMTLFSMTIVIPLGFCILRCCITSVLSEDLQQTATEVEAVATANFSADPSVPVRPPSPEPVLREAPSLPVGKEIEEAIRVFMTASAGTETDTMRKIKNLLISHDFERIKSYCEDELAAVHYNEGFRRTTAAAIFALKYAHLAASQEIFEYLCSRIPFGQFGGYYTEQLLFQTIQRETERSGRLRILLNQLNRTLSFSDKDRYLKDRNECGLTLMHYAVLYEDQEAQKLLNQACPELMSTPSLSMDRENWYPGFFKVGKLQSAPPLEFAQAFWAKFYRELAYAHITDRLPTNARGEPMKLFPGWDETRGRNFSEVIAQAGGIDAEDAAGLTLLHYAALHQKKEMIEQLKQRSAMWEKATLMNVRHWYFGAYSIEFNKALREKISPKNFPDACVDRLLLEYVRVRLSEPSCSLWNNENRYEKRSCMAVLRLLHKRLEEKGLFAQSLGTQTDEERVRELQVYLDGEELRKVLGYVGRADLGARHLFGVACREKRYDLAKQLLDLGLDPLDRNDIHLSGSWGLSEREKMMNSPFTCLKNLPVSEAETVKKLEAYTREKIKKNVMDSFEFPEVLGQLISEYVELLPTSEKVEEAS